MLRFARWLLYRDKVMEQLDTLLVMYPRRRQFAADFPGLTRAVREHFDAGVSPGGSAAQLAAGIVGGLIRQLSPPQRAAVRARMAALESAALSALAYRRIARRQPGLDDPVAFTAELAGVALFLSRRMAEEAALHRSDLEFLQAEIAAALGGGPDDDGAAR